MYVVLELLVLVVPAVVGLLPWVEVLLSCFVVRYWYCLFLVSVDAVDSLGVVVLWGAPNSACSSDTNYVAIYARITTSLANDSDRRSDEKRHNHVMIAAGSFLSDRLVNLWAELDRH